ncbi:MAG TPA: type II secretion system F family protein [Tepidisphaeraceae bacterium]|jgi:type IV pilus assembly protein PilC|nr:type II secretion system F family protein [Tepidisphaeraceae bacterium]
MTLGTDEFKTETFRYAAQTFDGQAMNGTIDAPSIDDASQRLRNLQLRVIQIDIEKEPPRAKPLSKIDFAMFNQQLAHLTSAGLPVEQGLRLIAEDLDHGGLAQTVRSVADELERGTPMGEAFSKHEKQFPPLYGVLISAGVQTGNLPGVLLNLGRHLDVVARLRAALWRASAYPITVFGALLLVLIFLGHTVLPQFAALYNHWFVELPGLTKFLLAASRWTPLLMVFFVLVFIGTPLLWMLLRAMRLDRAAADLALPLPMVGSVLQRELVARWCDALRLGVQAGLDLPRTVQLAADIVGSPALARDTRVILQQLSSGQPIDQLPARLSVLPTSVLAVLQMAIDRSDLTSALDTLATMYQQQAELRIAAAQNVLTPLLVLLVGGIIAVVVLGLFLPVLNLFRYILM